MAVWRLIESPPSDIFSQMALDEELFEEFLQSHSTESILRIYQVTQPALTVGYSHRKRLERLFRRANRAVPVPSIIFLFKDRDSPCGADDPAANRRSTNWRRANRAVPDDPAANRRSTNWRRAWGPSRKDLPLCVRPTGGGLVEHGKDLIYSVIARRDSFPTFHQVRTSYLSFHEAVQEAFQKLGIETHLLRCDEARRARHYETECFTHPVATDVMFQEKKIAGGAQRRKGEAFLHQGSIQILDGITFADLRQAFVEAFECQLGAMWQEASKEVKI